ncbi:MAG TPA: PD-(D/E)XK nuclease family protein [Solirubrobacteraceae bacterium]|nr:PD-(D/E)XK nuclease family protein [Solirubrobacteraceae bacterium]
MSSGPAQPLELRDTRALAELSARPWSASSLELWIACPARWFVERMLRAQSVEPDPEPLARGGLAHAVLADTLEGLRERTGSARLIPERLELARELLARALSDHEPRYPLSASPERVPGARRRLEADLMRYLAHTCSQASPLEPSFLELGFGFESDDPGAGDRRVPDEGREVGLPALDLGGGVKLRGRIDRIDVGPGGEAVVYDYKGASVTPSARWIADGKIQLALYMHAARELLGLEVVGGMYQPLGGVDLRARGVLAASASFELDCVRTDVVDAGELDEIVSEALALARAAAAEAVAGAVDARPATCTYTGGCEYPAICRTGR